MLLVQDYRSIVLAVASVSLLADLLTVSLIVSMGKRTGFLMLVMSLSMSQLLYDIGFFFRNSAEESQGPVAFDFLTFTYIFTQILGGIATTLITNAIAFIVAIIAFTLRSYDIAANLKYIAGWIFFLAFVPAMCAAILRLTNPALWYYPYYYYISLRAVSIVVNIVLCGMLIVRLNGMGIYIFSGKSNDSIHPIAALSSRMILYPIIQVLTRLGAIWMELAYPAGTVADDDSALHDDPSYRIALTLFSIFGPAAGIGFFVVFIFMQPKALMHLYKWLRCLGSGLYFKADLGDNEEERGGLSPGNDIKTDLLRSGSGGNGDGGERTNEEPSSPGRGEIMSDISLDSNDDDRHHSGVGSLLRLEGGGRGGRLSRDNSGTANPITIDQRSSRVSGSHLSRSGQGYPPRTTNTTTMSGGMDLTGSYSGNERFLRENLDHLDDEQLAQLVDRLAEGQHDEVPDNELLQGMNSGHSDSYGNSPTVGSWRS